MSKNENASFCRFFRIPWWGVVVILLFLALALFGERGVLRVLEASRQRHNLQADIQRLETKNTALQKEIQALRSDKKFIEDIARKELGMVGENEVVFVFPAESTAGTQR